MMGFLEGLLRIILEWWDDLMTKGKHRCGGDLQQGRKSMRVRFAAAMCEASERCIGRESPSDYADWIAHAADHLASQFEEYDIICDCPECQPVVNLDQAGGEEDAGSEE